jgi:rubredoxin
MDAAPGNEFTDIPTAMVNPQSGADPSREDAKTVAEWLEGGS